MAGRVALGDAVCGGGAAHVSRGHLGDTGGAFWSRGASPRVRDGAKVGRTPLRKPCMDSIVTLFSGAGGLSLGFKAAGLAPAFAADSDPDACATYGRNLGLDAHVLDLGAADPSRLLRLLAPFRDCAAVVGGPPCQGFSTAGARRADDPRNSLVFRYFDIVDFLNPRWFLFENVEGLLTSGGGRSIHDLTASFIARGYAVRVEKVNFAAYGLPQSRKRVLIMGNRIGLPFHLPEETHSYSAGKHRSRTLLPFGPSLAEAIADLPAAAAEESALTYGTAPVSPYAAALRLGSEDVAHHYAAPSKADAARYALLGPGQTMKDLPEEAWHPSFRARAFRRVSDGTPTERRGGAPFGLRRLVAADAAPTVTGAASREFVHPTEDRPLTLREAARLQSFPDSFTFSGPHAAKAQQIGNAVPPLAASRLAAALHEADGRAGAGVGRRSARPGLLGFRLTDSAGKSPALQEAERRLLGLGRAEEAVHG